MLIRLSSSGIQDTPCYQMTSQLGSWQPAVPHTRLSPSTLALGPPDHTVLLSFQTHLQTNPSPRECRRAAHDIRACEPVGDPHITLGRPARHVGIDPASPEMSLRPQMSCLPHVVVLGIVQPSGTRSSRRVRPRPGRSESRPPGSSRHRRWRSATCTAGWLSRHSASARGSPEASAPPRRSRPAPPYSSR